MDVRMKLDVRVTIHLMVYQPANDELYPTGIGHGDTVTYTDKARDLRPWAYSKPSKARMWVHLLTKKLHRGTLYVMPEVRSVPQQ